MPKEAVKDREGAAALEELDEARAVEGKKPSDRQEDRPEISRIMEENRKLREQLEKQKEETEEYRGELEDRLAELESKKNPSRSQESEMEDIEAELRALDANPKTKVWDERISRKSDAVSKKNLLMMDRDMAMEWIEEVADGLPKGDLYSNPKKLETAIVAVIQERGYGNKPLRVKVKKAWKEIQSERAKETEAEEAKRKSIDRREESGLPPIDRKHSDYVGLAKEGKINRALDAIFDKQIKEQRARENR